MRCRIGFCNPCDDSFVDSADCGTFGGDVVDTPETAPAPAQDPAPAQAPAPDKAPTPAQAVESLL
ncbi:MAG: hypothetical protein IJH67_10780 [Thermoguttaceae bacterium]|nr:hypothetical protein [Thermoguttaceae bacterium]